MKLLLTSDTIKAVWRYNGIRGFYRGLGPTVLGYLPTLAIYFAVYDGIKTMFGELPLGSQTRETDRIYPAAQAKGYQLEPGARGYVYNADLVTMIDFLDIGTRAVQDRTEKV